ncbi:MAG: tetraacyldisaccharide 4'-kinase [Planctomycetota bacterium]
MGRLDDVQRGEGRAWGAVARIGLSALSVAYGAALEARRLLHALGGRRPRRLPRPVVSVGNLAVGGTGKTPFTALLARLLLDGGRHPAILSRGYGPRVGPIGLSDEGAVLAHLLGPSVPQREDPDRLRGGRALLASHPEIDVFLLDDGFQHWRLARNLDIVLLDATNPFGYGRLLPRGRLRERPAALGRADLLVLTRTGRVGADRIGEVRERLGRVAPTTPVLEVRTRPVAFDRAGRQHGVESLRGRAVFACCGVGNPEAFVALLRDLGADVVGRRFFADHADPGQRGWETVLDAAQGAGADVVVTTRKDAVKCPVLPAAVGVLDIDLEVTEGRQHLDAALAALPRRSRPPA